MLVFENQGSWKTHILSLQKKDIERIKEGPQQVIKPKVKKAAIR